VRIRAASSRDSKKDSESGSSRAGGSQRDVVETGVPGRWVIPAGPKRLPPVGLTPDHSRVTGQPDLSAARNAHSRSVSPLANPPRIVPLFDDIGV